MLLSSVLLFSFLTTVLLPFLVAIDNLMRGFLLLLQSYNLKVIKYDSSDRLALKVSAEENKQLNGN
jgi:hypothetical protein